MGIMDESTMPAGVWSTAPVIVVKEERSCLKQMQLMMELGERTDGESNASVRQDQIIQTFCKGNLEKKEERTCEEERGKRNI